MDETEEVVLADSFDTDAIARSLADAEQASPSPRRHPPSIWWLLLLLVIVFGYLNAERRATLGKFAAQVADIVRDFRGYEPEF
jgi:hypothetical protein